MTGNPDSTSSAGPDSPAPWAAPIRLRALSASRPTAFDLRPPPETTRALARALGLTGLRRLSFRGTISALEGGGWHLRARLGATVEQPCRVSLVPVRTRIDEPVERRFLPDADREEHAAGSETEIPQDVDIEPLGNEIDPGLIMAEALALALPPFPRAEGAVLAMPASSPEDAGARERHPFAGLDMLRARLEAAPGPEEAPLPEAAREQTAQERGDTAAGPGTPPERQRHSRNNGHGGNARERRKGPGSGPSPAAGAGPRKRR